VTADAPPQPSGPARLPPPELAPPLPTELQVEITSACNLRCAMCLVSYRPPVNKVTGAMAPEMFAALVDSLPELRRLTLQGLGEPLLSPYLLDMVRRVKARGIVVGFNSNATLLSRRMAAELVAAGLDWLHVSLDGASAPTFEGIRAGADFDRVVANLAGLVAAKRAAGSATPWVRAVFVAMRRNVAELPDLVRLLARIGVDELRVQNLSHTFSDTDPAGRYAGIRRFTAREALWTGAGGDADAVRRAFQAARAAADEHGLLLRLPRLAPTPVRRDSGPGCTWPWDAAYVTSAGVVQPCCMVMGDDRIALGRLDEQSFPEIWYGEPYREFRRRLAADQPPDVCRGCALYHRTF
jgi:radical SAM protein with 4Fe4S-binding SPASM domain